MYIQPNTTIKILHNIPFDPTYEHTAFFTNRQTQYETFAGKAKYTLTAQSYQRVEKNKMRVQIKAENLYDCNYLMFRNNAFDDVPNRWFYAFITKVEYVNNLVSEITYELDVMQTWFFDYNLRESFVEREHSDTDLEGDNTLPENVPLGDYLYTEDNTLANTFNNYAICIAMSEVPPSGEGTQWSGSDGGWYCGVYSGVKYEICRTADAANAILTRATDDNKSDAIISVFMIPSMIYNAENFSAPVSFNINIPRITSFIADRMPGVTYTPRNKKLLTYPYAFYTIMDTDGNKAEYKQEYFLNKDDMKLNVKAAINTTPEYGIFPVDYKNISGYNFVEGMITGGAPQCAYAIDSYRAWLAQRKYPLKLEKAGIVAGALIGGAEAITGAATGELKTVVKGAKKLGAGFAASLAVLARDKQAQTLPAQMNGSANNILTMGTQKYGFHAYITTIRTEYAEIIDDFFDRYGYACLKNKIPNRDVRQLYCFTKTTNCTIAGNMPADDEETICNIYNNGITFWKNINLVGDYSQPNRPTHEG